MATTTVTQQKQNLETYSVIWLDATVNSSEENVEAQRKLRTRVNYLTIFEDDNECEDYIRSTPKEDRIILIVSGRLGKKIVPRTHHLQQIFSIYVYCFDEKTNSKWAENFCKIKAVIVILDELIKKVLSDQEQRKTNKIDEAFSISVFSTAATEEGQSTSEINGHFIHSQLLIDCLIRMKPTSTEKNELISLCRKEYEGNNEQLTILEEFAHDYSPSYALWWYTRQSFLYRLLNKALRIQNIDLLFLFRFFIRDIEGQLQNSKCTSPIRVYRGQLMSEDEVRMLKNSVGEFISINAFLSTSLNRKLSLSFITNADVSNGLERVFFEIDANPELENLRPFSNITSQSYFPDEEEILFMIGSIFQLLRVHLNENGIWVIGMELSASNDHQVKSLLEYLRNEYNDHENTVLSFADVLFKMGKFNDAEKYYHLFLDKLSLNDNNLARCYDSLGSVAMKKDNLDSSLIWLNKSLDRKLRTFGAGHPEVARCYNKMGQVYRKKREFDQALELSKRALAIWEKTLDKNSAELAQSFGDIGNLYQAKKDFLKALEYHQKALSINKKLLPEYHCNMGILHTSIATAYRCLEQFNLSLEHADNALKIFQKSLPSHHSQIGWVYENIGLVYEKQGKLQKSLFYLEKALTNYCQTLPVTHFYIVDVKQNIQRVSSQLK